MRVAFLSVSAQMGGSESVLLQILRGLRQSRAGWRLQLVAPREGSLPSAARASGIDVAVVGMPASIATIGETAAVNGTAVRLPWQLLRAAVDLPRYRRDLEATLGRLAPDLVHTNGFKAHLFAARRRSGAALIWHVHEYISRRPLTRALLRRYASRCAAIVANSQSVAADIRGVIDGVPIATIHNAVDLEAFSPGGAAADLDALCGLPSAAPGTIRVGLPATFARWKGHTVFLDALAMLPRETPVRGYIIGAPLYDTRGSQHTVAELQEHARAVGAGGRIGFTGFVDRPADALRALDIVVHASTEPEPFGMVIAEAMACGRAVITTAAGGAAELVQPDRDAVVHRRGDAADLARCITSLVADPERRRRLGEQARAAALERFDARRMTEQFARLYEETLGARRT